MIDFLGSNKPAWEVVTLLDRIRFQTNAHVAVAQVGVGTGDTSREILNILAPGDSFHLFDNSSAVDQTVSEFKRFAAGEGVNVAGFGTNASPSYSLADFAMNQVLRGESLVAYDVAFLNGAAGFDHEAAACSLLKGMIKLGGYIIIDSGRDGKQFDEGSLLIQELLLETDPDFKSVKFSGSRLVYQKSIPF